MQAIRSKLCTVVSQISNVRNSSCHEYIKFKQVLLKIIHKFTCTGEINKQDLNWYIIFTKQIIQKRTEI